ncbi:MAG: sodium:calcium antiporter [Halothece sp.]
MDIGQLVFYFFLIIVCAGIVWQGSFMLEDSADRLSAFYQLPPIVQGSIVAAVGSSFPELSSTVIATVWHGEFELGISAIVGSAIFNILVVPSLSGIISGNLNVERVLVYKDAQFYITSITVLLLAFAFALIYNPVEGFQWQGRVNRPIALIPIALYGLYIFLQQQDVSEAQQDSSPPKDIQLIWQWLRLLFSLGLIAVSVEGLVRVAIGLGDLLQTPNFLWGLTITAIATSLPDAFVSIKSAREGNSTISLANVLGSNIFDLLIAIPIGVLIAGASTVNFAVAAPMMGILTVATIALFTMLRLKLVLSQTECWILLGLYAAFFLWMVLETFGITNFIQL